MNIFRKIAVLRNEGKIHSRLLGRTRILFIISTIILAVIAYESYTKDVYAKLMVVFAIVGFMLGLFVFSKMNIINWDEEKELVISGRMDKLGYATLALYIVFEVGFRHYLKIHYPTEVLPLLLSGIFGTIFGRAVGTLVEINRVYNLHHSKN